MICTSQTEKVTVRFPVPLIEDLEDIVLRYGYRNTSEVVRKAVDEFVEGHRAVPVKTKVQIKIPNGLANTMDDLIELQLFSDYTDIILFATRYYVEDRVRNFRSELEDFESAIAGLRADHGDRVRAGTTDATR